MLSCVSKMTDACGRFKNVGLFYLLDSEEWWEFLEYTGQLLWAWLNPFVKLINGACVNNPLSLLLLLFLTVVELLHGLQWPQWDVIKWPLQDWVVGFVHGWFPLWHDDIRGHVDGSVTCVVKDQTIQLSTFTSLWLESLMKRWQWEFSDLCCERPNCSTQQGEEEVRVTDQRFLVQSDHCQGDSCIPATPFPS